MEHASEGGDGEDPQDSGFITRMFDKVATSALSPSSLPTKITPHHFQVGPLLSACLLIIFLSVCLCVRHYPCVSVGVC